MYYTVIKHSGHLRTLEKCRKHSAAARVVYISLVFSNARRVLSHSNTRLRLLYLLSRVLWLIVRLKCILARLNKLMKSENQIILQCKQPIKTEKPLQRLLPFSYSVGEKNILQNVFLSFSFF